MGVLAVAHILGFDELSVEGARVAAGFSTCRKAGSLVPGNWRWRRRRRQCVHRPVRLNQIGLRGSVAPGWRPAQ